MPSDHPAVQVSPIFPVTDLARALEHYAALGCLVSRYDATYGFAARAGVELHLVVVADHDPARTASAAYLHVPDADALAEEWRHVEVTGVPEDKPWGLREGWHRDPDGNLLRFGSPLASAR